MGDRHQPVGQAQGADDLRGGGQQRHDAPSGAARAGRCQTRLVQDAGFWSQD